jgi:hypothetical protein
VDVAVRRGINMQGDENISIILIGDLSPLVEFDEFVSSAGVDNLDPVQVLFDIFAQPASIPPWPGSITTVSIRREGSSLWA